MTVSVIDRRAFLVGSPAISVAPPLAAEAQQPRRIAFLCPISCSTLPHVVTAGDRAFLSGLTRAGFSGGDLYFDLAGGGVGYERLSETALQIAKRNPDVVSPSGMPRPARLAGLPARSRWVMVGVADPVEDGLIRSLGRPGGNLTGLAIPYEQLVATAGSFRGVA